MEKVVISTSHRIKSMKGVSSQVTANIDARSYIIGNNAIDKTRNIPSRREVERSSCSFHNHAIHGIRDSNPRPAP